MSKTKWRVRARTFRRLRLVRRVISRWYRGWDSNPYDRSPGILSPVRLPFRHPGKARAVLEPRAASAIVDHFSFEARGSSPHVGCPTARGPVADLWLPFRLSIRSSPVPTVPRMRISLPVKVAACSPRAVSHPSAGSRCSSATSARPRRTRSSWPATAPRWGSAGTGRRHGRDPAGRAEMRPTSGDGDRGGGAGGA